MKTLAPLNPRNPGAIDLITDVELQESGSAYARSTNAEGNAVGHPLTSVAHAYDRLLRELVSIAPPIRETVTVPMFWIALEDGQAVIKKRGLYTGLRTVQTVKSGRFAKRIGVEGGALLDKLFRNENLEVEDRFIWAALRDLVQEHADSFRDGESLKSLNNSVALLVLLRSGVVGNVNSLGRVGGSHDRVPT